MAFVSLVMGVFGLPALVDRRAARAVTRAWAHLMLAGLRVLCGVDYRVAGAANIPRGAAIVAANHQSMWETIALLALLDRPAMVLKKELLGIPIYGWWAARTGVPVDRKAGAKAMRLLRRQTQRHIARGDQIVVFPEGTRRRPGDPGPLLPGVAGMYLAANAPIVPVVHNSGEFWRHPGIERRPGMIAIRFLPPIPSGLDRRAMMNALAQGLRESPVAERPQP